MRAFRSRLSLVAAAVSLVVLTQLSACGSDDDSGVNTDGATTDGISTDSTGGGDTGPVGDDTGGSTTDTGGSTTDTGGGTDGGGGCAPASCGVDTDCDGISDTVEGRFAPGGAPDTDKDGKPDWQDDDSDGDGIPDRLEWRKVGCDPLDDANDSDGDGIPNFQDLDSDGNGLPDKDEVCPPAAMLAKLEFPKCEPLKPYDFDSDGLPDYLDFDNDHDSSKTDKKIGLSDLVELSDATGKYVGLVDTDGDGIPDVYDIDSDNDFILDLDDGITDPDGDGKPSFRDDDSDGDGVDDKCEARANASPTAADYYKPVRDTDGDGAPDYLDRDSDNDLLGDGFEDFSNNCTVDTAETDRIKADTDGDGVGDLGEVSLLGTPGAKDATATPEKAGKFYFVLPYSADGSAAPSPASAPLALATTLNKGDLGIIVDTSNSMDAEFKNLQTNLGTIIDGLKTKFDDVGIGIAGHDDFPTWNWDSVTTYPVCTAPTYSCPVGSACYDLGLPKYFCLPPYLPNQHGTCNNASYGKTSPPSDDPYYQLTAITNDKAAAVAAVKGLRMSSGEDLPEDQVAAMMHAFTGVAISWPAMNGCPSGSRPTVADTATLFGALRFRAGSFPILLSLSDAAFHNGITRAAPLPPPATGVCLYGPGSPTCKDTARQPVIDYSFPSPKIAELAAALKAKNASFIGAAADDARAAQIGTTIYVSGPAAGPKTGVVSAARNPNWMWGAYGDMEYLVDETKSYADPEDFTHSAICPAGQCCTGFGGAGIAPDAPGGKCKLVINVNHDGSGLNTSIVDAVLASLGSLRYDVHVEATPAAGPVDSVATFIEKIEPSPTGGKDPTTGDVCVTFPASALADKYNTPKAVAGAGDIKETILQVKPGPKHCFNVVPKANTTVKPTTTAQLFTATLRIIGEKAASGASPLGKDRDVLFIVPPQLN